METIKISKIDNKNIPTMADITTNIIIKIILVCSLVVVGCELYVLLKL